MEDSGSAAALAPAPWWPTVRPAAGGHRSARPWWARQAWESGVRSWLLGQITPPCRVKANADLPPALAESGYVVVLDGVVAHCVATASGRRRIVGLLMAGDLCCDRSCGDRDPDWFVALTTSHVASLPSAAVHHLSRTCPEVGRALWRVAGRSAGIHREWLRNDAQAAGERLAHRICEVAVRQERAAPHGSRATVPHLRQAAWADMTAMTVMHVNRCLRRLREDGLIGLAHGAVTVPNFARLAAFGEFDPGYLRPRAPLPADDLGEAIAGAAATGPLPG